MTSKEIQNKRPPGGGDDWLHFNFTIEKPTKPTPIYINCAVNKRIAGVLQDQAISMGMGPNDCYLVRPRDGADEMNLHEDDLIVEWQDPKRRKTL